MIRVVNSLESKTSAGYDFISMQLIKSIILFIAQPLPELINESFVTGSFPNELKLLVSVLSLKVGMQQIF